MKIGILTLLPRYNYGGILQCLALQSVLEGMGHEVKVIRFKSQRSGTLKRRLKLLVTDFSFNEYIEWLHLVTKQTVLLQRRVTSITNSLKLICLLNIVLFSSFSQFSGICLSSFLPYSRYATKMQENRGNKNCLALSTAGRGNTGKHWANRLGEIFSPLSHHRTCCSAYGGST